METPEQPYFDWEKDLVARLMTPPSQYRKITDFFTQAKLEVNKDL